MSHHTTPVQHTGYNLWYPEPAAGHHGACVIQLCLHYAVVPHGTAGAMNLQ